MAECVCQQSGSWLYLHSANRTVTNHSSCIYSLPTDVETLSFTLLFIIQRHITPAKVTFLYFSYASEFIKSSDFLAETVFLTYSTVYSPLPNIPINVLKDIQVYFKYIWIIQVNGDSSIRLFYQLNIVDSEVGRIQMYFWLSGVYSEKWETRIERGRIECELEIVLKLKIPILWLSVDG